MSASDLNNQEKLEEVYRLTLENNHLLHKIQSRDRLALTLRIVYWLAILGILGGAFYYIKPFFEAITGTGESNSIMDQFEQLRSELPEAKFFQQFLDQMQAGEAAQPMVEQG